MRFGVRGKLAHRLHESRVSHIVWTRLLTLTGMLQIEAVAPTPLPRVVQIEHCYHVALAHLHEQVIETSEDGIVVNTWFNLQRWFHLGLHATLTIGPHKDAQVVDAHTLHRIELGSQALAVATLSLRGEDSTIPEISAYIIIRFTVANEMTINDMNKRVLVGLLLVAGYHRQGHEGQE